MSVFRSILIAFILLLATAWTGAFSTSGLCMDGQKNRNKDNAVLKELPYGQTLATDYDASKRPTSITDELGNVTSFEPTRGIGGEIDNPQGWGAAPRSRAERPSQTTYAYDQLGRRVARTLPNGQIGADSTTTGWNFTVNREQQAVIQYLLEEIRALREMMGKAPRFNNCQRRRLAVKAKKLGSSKRKEFASLATPETLMRWYRKLVAKKYDSSESRKRGKVGRPRTGEVIEKLVVRMARENECWGYTRIRDALDNLGHEISRGTVANILRDHGIEPAPERGPQTSWADFLKRHWHVLAATDFFTVEVCTLKGMVRYHVHFVIKLATREVHVSGISAAANGQWMEQIARNLTDGFDGFLNGCKYLIHDRDPLFTAGFRKILGDEGIESLRLPRKSPNLNAYAERFVRSIKGECLGRMVFFSEKSLRYAITEYVEHYHCERNHQGLDGKIIRPDFDGGESANAGDVQCRERIGGLLNFYYHDAA